MISDSLVLAGLAIVVVFTIVSGEYFERKREIDARSAAIEKRLLYIGDGPRRSAPRIVLPVSEFDLID